MTHKWERSCRSENGVPLEEIAWLSSSGNWSLRPTGSPSVYDPCTPHWLDRVLLVIGLPVVTINALLPFSSLRKALPDDTHKEDGGMQ